MRAQSTALVQERVSSIKDNLGNVTEEELFALRVLRINRILPRKLLRGRVGRPPDLGRYET